MATYDWRRIAAERLREIRWLRGLIIAKSLECASEDLLQIVCDALHGSGVMDAEQADDLAAQIVARLQAKRASGIR